jgi:Ni/Fe-hydrogenase 1 B-type cytochrome subunit
MGKDRIRVYAWEFPVRLTHWINVLCIIALAITGYYIGNPFIHAVSSKEYVMGWVRFIHFVAAYTFLFSIILRLYWSLVGNRYANWTVFFPYSGRALKDLFQTLAFYLFLRKKPPYAVGHTAFAGFTYFFVFLIYWFMIFSGFAMYALNRDVGTLWTVLGGWMTGFLHLQTIRLFHHLGMYVLLAFTVTHVYIAWYLDVKERNGLMGSIFGGYKFVTGKEWE